MDTQAHPKKKNGKSSPYADRWTTFISKLSRTTSPNGEVFDTERRFLTTTRDGATWHPELKWRVRPQRMTSLKKGVGEFFQKQYADAVHQFSVSQSVNDTERHPKVSCHAYRMACAVRLACPNDVSIRQDFDAIERLGGAKAALIHGVYDR